MAEESFITRMVGHEPEAIGLRIRLRREMLGWDEEEAARRYGVSEITWKRMEAGQRQYNSDLLFELSALLDCSLHYLLDFPDEFGATAVDYYLHMLWTSLPPTDENPWMRTSLLETLRKTVMGYVVESRRSAPREELGG